MTLSLVECVPNFSEGRRPEVIEEIRFAISEVPGTFVLDTHTDADHNRSVVTFVGDPPAVEEAAFRMIKKAAQLINLEEHSGEDLRKDRSRATGKNDTFSSHNHSFGEHSWHGKYGWSGHGTINRRSRSHILDVAIGLAWNDDQDR